MAPSTNIWHTTKSSSQLQQQLLAFFFLNKENCQFTTVYWPEFYRIRRTPFKADHTGLDRLRAIKIFTPNLKCPLKFLRRNCKSHTDIPLKVIISLRTKGLAPGHK